MTRDELVDQMNSNYHESLYYHTIPNSKIAMYQLLRFLEIKGIIVINEKEEVRKYNGETTK